MLFREFGLRSEILTSLETMGYHEPTEVQSQVIPLALSGKHVIAQSQTGSGKTASFVIPILNMIDPNIRKPQALILEPTRELAMQSKEEVWNLSKGIRMRSAVVFGGSYIRKQREELMSGPQIVIATPGRLIDLMERGWIDLSAVKMLVIDEVDLMLDMGFIDAVNTIWKSLTSLRQVMTFSATYSEPIKRLISQHIGSEYQSIQISQSITVDSIEHVFIRVAQMDKYPLLRDILMKNSGKRTIIFTKMKSETEELSRYLERDGIRSAFLHGDLFQRDRIRILRDYKEGRIHTFIATDIAARGLNMNSIDIVINYHVPHDPEAYIHRIGRTGRAGASGQAFMLVSSDETRQLERIERVNRIQIKEIDREGNSIPRTKHLPRGNGTPRRRPGYRGGYKGGRSDVSPQSRTVADSSSPRRSSQEHVFPKTPRPIKSYREQSENFFGQRSGKFFPESRNDTPRKKHIDEFHRYEERRENHPREYRTNGE